MKRLRLFAVSLVFLLVLGVMATPVAAAEGGPFASFTQGIKQRWNRFYLMLPGNKSGEAVLQQSTAAMENVKSMQFKMMMSGEGLTADNQPAFSGNLSFSGPAEVKDVYDPKATRQDLNVNGEFSMQGTTLKANADMKIDGKTSYLRVNELPALPFMDLSKLKGQWLKMEPKNEMAEEKTTETTAEQKKQMEQAFMDFMKASKISEARKEKLNGVNVFVIDVVMSDEAVITYASRLAEIQNTPKESIEEQKTQLREFLAATDELKATIYVDRSTYYTRKLDLPLVVDASKLEDDQAGAESTAVSPLGNLEDIKTVKVALVIEMDKFNDPVNFQLPDSSRPMEEVMMEVMSGLGGSSSMMAPSQTQKMDLEARARAAGEAANPKRPQVRPTELPALSAEEKQMLKQYGVDVEGL